MGRLTLPTRLTWQIGEVTGIVQETPKVATLTIEVPAWSGHLAGQHVDVRLTADDGYQTQRSYSIASPPEEPRLAITVERLEDGEVSPYLVGELRPKDKLELRGPIGGYFVWRAGDRRPLLLIAGGSGIVPLMSMIRHRAAAGDHTAVRLLYSSRALEDVIYRMELERLAAANQTLTVAHTLTRSQPAGWNGYARRLDRAMIEDVAWPVQDSPQVFICGPTSFVEAAAGLLVDHGYDAGWIKTERFGATGG
ncbi:MAG TPA: ferredoxin reductase [Candidatus Dormibacteraeota bacterium]|nr:ferredoxin reductase [Candidatus Dormibacteraeota bacterium]